MYRIDIVDIIKDSGIREMFWVKKYSKEQYWQTKMRNMKKSVGELLLIFHKINDSKYC